MALEPSGADTRMSTVGLVAIAVVGGIAATWSELHPTGYAAWDRVLVGGLAALVIWVASVSPWWATTVLSGAAGLAAARDADWVLVGVAVAAVLIAVATARFAEPMLASLSTALSIAVLARLDDGPFFGATAIYSLFLVACLLIVCLAHQQRGVRLAVSAGLAAFFAVLVIGAVGFGIAAAQGATEVRDANRIARAGIRALRGGDFAEAAVLLESADESYRDAQESLDRPWAVLGRIVPVVAQNRAAAVRLVNSAQEVTGRATVAATQIDPEQLRIVDGAIDVAAVAALSAPVADLQTAISDLQATLDETQSEWVPSQVTDRLEDVADDVDGYRTQVDNLALAVAAAPGMLGADGVRNYFIAFSTPAELRGFGGFVGNYAVLTVDAGRFELTDFGRSDDLRLAAPADGMEVDLPDDFRRRYGEFGFADGPGGSTLPVSWKQIGASPDMPTTTAIVQQMWAATFDTEIDGMVVIDPYPLAQFLEYTGPQTIPGYATPIGAGNAAEFILREQYKLFEQEQRVDLLEVLAEETIDALLAGAMPSPVQAAKDLGPFVAEHRLMMWTSDPGEQEMLDAVGLSGRFPPATGDAGYGITFNNAAANKMDAYLAHDVQATARTDVEFGDVIDVTMRLQNAGVVAELPDFVTQNAASGFEPGTIYLYVSAYGATEPLAATRDGESLGVETDVELDNWVASTFVDLEAGASTTIIFTFEAQPVGTAPDLRVFVSPTAQRP